MVDKAKNAAELVLVGIMDGDVSQVAREVLAVVRPIIAAETLRDASDRMAECYGNTNGHIVVPVSLLWRWALEHDAE